VAIARSGKYVTVLELDRTLVSWPGTGEVLGGLLVEWSPRSVEVVGGWRRNGSDFR